MGQAAIKEFFLPLLGISSRLVADVSLSFQHIPCTCSEMDNISTWKFVIFSARIIGEPSVVQDTVNRLRKQYKTKED
jgi:hypothetical protein